MSASRGCGRVFLSDGKIWRQSIFSLSSRALKFHSNQTQRSPRTQSQTHDEAELRWTQLYQFGHLRALCHPIVSLRELRSNSCSSKIHFWPRSKRRQKTAFWICIIIDIYPVFARDQAFYEWNRFYWILSQLLVLGGHFSVCVSSMSRIIPVVQTTSWLQFTEKFYHYLFLFEQNNKMMMMMMMMMMVMMMMMMMVMVMVMMMVVVVCLLYTSPSPRD